MNNTKEGFSPVDADALEARYAMRITAGLSEQAQSISSDISERLRFAREQALVRAAAVRLVAASNPQVVSGGASTALLAGGGWWVKAGSILPLLVLVAGLLLIQYWQNKAQISVAAEVDTALLSDTLPPAAYSDAGFVEFLKTPRD